MLRIDEPNFLNLHPTPESKKLHPEDQLRQHKIQEQSKELEKVFVTYLVKALEKTIPEGVFNSKQSNLTSMLFSSVMADALVERGGFGLSEMIAQSLNEKEARLTSASPIPILDALEILKTGVDER